MNYIYTNNWFEGNAKHIWDGFIPLINSTRILEIGSYEGASASYFIENIARDKNIELHCIDTWDGGIEHVNEDMLQIEKRFYYNTNIANKKVFNNAELIVHKECSDVALSKLIAEGKLGYFDFIYIDGSHQAPDVLCDAILSFRLLKNNGFMVFDDYLWYEALSYGTDPIRCPKIAIDAFTNIYCRKVKIINAPLCQLFVQKISD